MRVIGARRGSGARLFDRSQLLRNGGLLKNQGIMSRVSRVYSALRHLLSDFEIVAPDALAWDLRPKSVRLFDRSREIDATGIRHALLPLRG